MKPWYLCVALGLACFAPLASGAEDRERSKGDTALSDTEFLIKAVSCGVAEVQFGEMAEKHASHADVKAFANRMVSDHKKANEKLLEHARALKVGVVTGLERDKREVASRLSKLEGADFDRDYMKQMVEDHEKAIAHFENYSRNGSNKELVTFAKETLPTLREHLKEAKGICDKLKR